MKTCYWKLDSKFYRFQTTDKAIHSILKGHILAGSGYLFSGEQVWLVDVCRSAKTKILSKIRQLNQLVTKVEN